MNIERALLENPDFRLLAPAERTALADAMTERRVRRGVELIEEGKEDDNLYVILSGQVEVTRRPLSASEVTVLGVLGPGALLGLVSLLAPGPHYGRSAHIGTARKAGFLVRRTLPHF